MSLNTVFEDLASNASRNWKLAYLKERANDETLREVVRLALDPFTQFYIRKIPAYTPNSTQYPASLKAILPALFDLSQRLVTGNAAINHLQMMLESVSPDDAKVLERIIQKDLKCGVSISTANDVWLGLIKEYPVMLCSGYDEKLVNKIQFPAFVQLKEDGMRFNAIVKDDKCEFKSRNGKTLDLLGNLEEEFVKMAGGNWVVYDGELLVKIDGKIADRQTGNGILNKANKGTISKDEAKLVTAVVWDAIPYAYFVDGYCGISYDNRFNGLQNLELPEKVELVPHIVVDSLDAAKMIFEDFLAAGKEGIILKDPKGEWEDKRSKGQIKFKGELECDLKITAMEEGTGKYSGQLGALICASSDNGIQVRVGSGLTDEQRKNLYTPELIGKIVAVKYNARIKNKLGAESLFLPIFIEVREDKDVADASGDIK